MQLILFPSLKKLKKKLIVLLLKYEAIGHSISYDGSYHDPPLALLLHVMCIIAHHPLDLIPRANYTFYLFVLIGTEADACVKTLKVNVHHELVVRPRTGWCFIQRRVLLTLILLFCFS